jgi:hypothetical protein
LIADVHLEEPLSNEACVWTEDHDGIWTSDCTREREGDGPQFCFNEDGPDENNFKFCPYCGKKLAAVYIDNEV